MKVERTLELWMSRDKTLSNQRYNGKAPDVVKTTAMVAASNQINDCDGFGFEMMEDDRNGLFSGNLSKQLSNPIEYSRFPEFTYQNLNSENIPLGEDWINQQVLANMQEKMGDEILSRVSSLDDKSKLVGFDGSELPQALKTDFLRSADFPEMWAIQSSNVADNFEMEENHMMTKSPTGITTFSLMAGGSNRSVLSAAALPRHGTTAKTKRAAPHKSERSRTLKEDDPCRPSTSLYPESLPTRDPFEIKAIATGLCQLFPSMYDRNVQLFDILAVKEAVTLPWPCNDPRGTITQISVQAKNPYPKHNGKKQYDSCTFMMKMMGDDEIKLRVWSNGRTQAYGCKSRDKLIEANTIAVDMIRVVDKMCKSSGMPTLWKVAKKNADELLQEDCVKIISAPLLGSWNMNFKNVGIKLNMDALFRFLQSHEFSDRYVRH
ncbi:hypothetical protein GUITHDRAFT_148237 [Guillardia theta CCMP2712]|uniref:Uncharacterized protein n=1 Tax=Guillardia theta (strain CCMP2712) TaxID=905079 RepID=L1I9T8_GUITC|nr:hypothetical protein GUITHDRAFT_148237 [Guillardia theta CCMP2712]EKX32993.1 hypothetical protein GUITHDRAFT_148237 [Guillardia theta CCMP2712]|eukprot:XP_005819973.1 hypothetical protein GUITHDRAFT_148237 [Guillardia theta CCMP2712]